MWMSASTTTVDVPESASILLEVIFAFVKWGRSLLKMVEHVFVSAQMLIQAGF